MSDSSIPFNPLSDKSADIELELSEVFQTLTINPVKKTRENFPKMSIPSFDFKLLQIVPEFDGNPCRLFRYISAATDLLNTYYDVANTNCVQNKILVNGILSKLTGPAEEIFSLSGSTEWLVIKDLLITHFGDQRNESSLLSDLGSLRQNNNEESLHFYSRVISTLNLLHNFINLHENNALVMASKKTLYDSHALHTLLVGLKEPQSSMIRAMKPNNLAEAQKYIIEDNNIRYLQKSSFIPKIQQNFKPKPIQYIQYQPNSQLPHENVGTRQIQHLVPQNFSTQPNLSVQNSFPSRPIQIQQRVNQQPHRFPTSSEVFGRPQNVWKNSPNGPINTKPTPMSIVSRNRNYSNANPMSMVSRNQNSLNPTPMSIVTRFTNQTRNNQRPRQNNYFQNNPNQGLSFISEELNNLEMDGTENEFSETYDYNPDNSFDETAYNYNDEESNFLEIQNDPDAT